MAVLTNLMGKPVSNHYHINANGGAGGVGGGGGGGGFNIGADCGGKIETKKYTNGEYRG